MTTHVSTIPVRNRATTVTVAASPVYIEMTSMPFPTTIAAIPGASGTLAVAYSCTPTAISDPGAANWINWPSGTVSAATSDTLISPIVALRVSATTATGTIEVVA